MFFFFSEITKLLKLMVIVISATCYSETADTILAIIYTLE